MKLSFLLLSVAIPAVFPVMGSQPTVVVQCSIPGVFATSAKTPEPGNLPSHIQALNENPLMASFQPYSLIVTNRSGQEIMGVALDMVLEDPAGKIMHKVATRTTGRASTEHRFGPGRSMNLSVLWLTDVVPPNELRSEVERLVQTLERQKNVTLVVDGVLLASGEYVGPNQTHEFEHLQARLHAGYDLAQRVVKHFENLGPDGDLVGLLNSTASTPFAAAPDGSRDWYADIQVSTAKQYLFAHSRGGADAVLRMARAAAAHPPMKIYRSEPVREGQ
jgi:hypothetical protein